jgi:hypothetical protein
MWAALQTASSAPLTLPSPPGRRAERVKLSLPAEPHSKCYLPTHGEKVEDTGHQGSAR